MLEKQPCRSSRRFSESSSEYFGDHNPPHFHVEFQGEKATFTFDGRLRSGKISSGTARKLVRDWARRHRLELMINWKNIEERRPLNRINPLE
jgi:hypothetical protein